MGKIRDYSYYFWDTSAIAKRYAREAGAEIVDAIVEDHDTVSFMSILTVVEIYTALGRKYRNREITQDEYANALLNLDNDLRNRLFRPVRIRNRDVSEAIEMAKRYPVGAIDAVILASGVNMWRGRETEVLFLVCEAAKTEGFIVYDPSLGELCSSLGGRYLVQPA